MRHASVAAEHAGRYLGRTDLPIAAAGHRAIQIAAEALARRNVRRCVASPLLRARQTAQIVASRLGLPMEIDNDLREVDFGRWEGKTFQEIAASDPDHVQKWANMAEDFAFPEGESWRAFQNRVDHAAQRLASDPADVVLAIAHGGVIRAMLCQLLDVPARHYPMFDVCCCGYCLVNLYDGKGVLSELIQPRIGETH